MITHSLKMFLVLCAAIVFALTTSVNASIQKLPSLPDVLRATDGTKVERADQWYSSRQQEIVEILRQEVYGVAPGKPADLSFNVTDNGTANSGGKRYIATISYSGPNGSNSVEVYLWVPNSASSSNPVPTIILNNHRSKPNINTPSSSFFPVSTIVARGYAAMYVHNPDTSLDVWTDFFTNGAHTAFDDLDSPRDPHAWGTLRAWAWGVSRGIDWLETFPQIDVARTVTIGHSRSGKAALIAGAFDERVALALPNNAGTCGPSLGRDNSKETLAGINTSFPHWMNHNFKRYAQEPYSMPFDQHWLIAAMAPRRVYSGTSFSDAYDDIYNVFDALIEAGPAYELLGLAGLGTTTFPGLSSPVQTGSLAFHVKSGGHSMNSTDWNFYMNYMDSIWSGVALDQEARVEKGTAIIADAGSYTDNTLEAGVAKYIPFAIRNHGRADLTITNPVSVSGTNCTVTVVSQPASVVTPDRVTTLGLEITPTSAGPWSVDVAMSNNDADEGVYNWTVQGNAATHTPRPKAVVYHGNYLPVVDEGGAYVVGTETNVSTIETFTIVNEGNATLTLSDITLANPNTVNASVNAQPASLSLAPGESTTFQLNVAPKIPSPWSVDASFTTNDPAVNVYNFKARGVAFVSELIITRDGTEILNNSVDTIDGLLAGVAHDITYQIGCGGAQGRIVPVLPYWLNTINCSAVVTVDPDPTIGSGTSDPLTIRVTPTNTGAWSVQVNFYSNDYDENTVEWTLQGVADPLPAGAEILFTRSGIEINDGGNDLVNGTIAGQSTIITYDISNFGADPLTLSTPVTVTATDATILVTQQPASSVASLGSTQLKISVTPSIVGAWSGSITIGNNDTDENPFDIALNGTASIPNLDLGAPVNISAIPNSGFEVALSWTNNAEDAQGYVIERRAISSANSFEKIIDNVDPEVTSSGFWNMTWGTGHYADTNPLESHASLGSGRYARFTPDISSENGLYEIYLWYANYSPCTNVPVTVTEGGVPRTIIVDQTQNTGQWFKLGDFQLETGDYVEISADFSPNPASSAQRVIADAVRFFKPIAGGPWSEIAAVSAGVTSYTDNNVDSLTTYEYRIRATSTFVNGDWSANTMVTTLNGTPLAEVANFSVSSTSTSQINLSWTASAETDSDYVIERRRTSTGDEYIIDNEDTSKLQITGTWNTSTNVAGYYGTNYLHDNKENLGSKKVKYLPAVNESGVYDIYLWYSTNASRATNVPVEIIHKEGVNTVLVDQTVNGGAWYKIATHTMDANSTLEMSNTGTDGYVTADGVRLVLTDQWMRLATVTDTALTSYADTDVTADAQYEYRIRVVKEDASNLSLWSMTSATASAPSGNNTYANWSGSIGWETADSTATADADGDGYPNLIEYALAGDPVSVDPLIATTVLNEEGIRKLAINFKKKRNTSDARIIVETSTNLNLWTEAFNFSPNQDITPSSDVSIITSDIDTQQIQVRIPFSADKLFIRIRVTDS